MAITALTQRMQSSASPISQEVAVNIIPLSDTANIEVVKNFFVQHFTNMRALAQQSQREDLAPYLDASADSAMNEYFGVFSLDAAQKVKINFIDYDKDEDIENKAIYLVKDSTKNLVGAIKFCQLCLNKNQKYIYVNRSFILPEHRGKGHMFDERAKLYHALFTTNTISYVESNIDDDNEPSQKLAKKLGAIKTQYFDNDDEYHVHADNFYTALQNILNTPARKGYATAQQIIAEF